MNLKKLLLTENDCYKSGKKHTVKGIMVHSTGAIIVAVITGILALFGNVVTSLSAARKTQNVIDIRQAVTDQKIIELTREVREHNNFARRMPVVEEQIKVVNHRISNLENK